MYQNQTLNRVMCFVAGIAAAVLIGQAAKEPTQQPHPDTGRFHHQIHSIMVPDKRTPTGWRPQLVATLYDTATGRATYSMMDNWQITNASFYGLLAEKDKPVDRAQVIKGDEPFSPKH